MLNSIIDFLRARPAIRIRVNEEGYVVTSHNHPDGPLEMHIEGKEYFTILLKF